MTHDKARDFFSAYHEDLLEPAMRLSFEQKLAADPTLREEYSRFEATVNQLSKLHETPIEIPFDLNERIGARLDRHLWEQKQSAPASIFSRLRSLAFGGLAVAALAGAFFSIRHFNKTAEAGMIASSSSDQLLVVVKHDALMVEFSPANKSTITFRTEPGDKPFAEVSADRSTPLNRRIDNPNSDTELISIQVVDAPEVEHVVLALPGTHIEKAKAGSGTLEDFIKALAARYRVPVKVTGGDPLTQVSWELDASDARQAAESALKGKFSVDQRDGNLVTISRT